MGLQKVKAMRGLQRGRAWRKLRLEHLYWDQMEKEEGLGRWHRVQGGAPDRGVGVGLALQGQMGTGGALSLYGVPLFSQGRDAGDQHIVDVVLKMLQGEGASGVVPAGWPPPRPVPHRPLSALQSSWRRWRSVPGEQPWVESVPWDPPDPPVPQGHLVSRAHTDPWDLEASPASWVLPGRLAT